MEQHAPKGAASYPRMALETARAITLCEKISSGQIIDIASSPARERCENVVISALNSRHVGTHKIVVTETLSGLILENAEEILEKDKCPSDAKVKHLRTIVQDVREGKIVKQLSILWDEIENIGNVDDTVSKFAVKGFNAQEMSWAVITFETRKHDKLIWHQANKLVKSFPDRQASDLFGWGWEGLRTALRRYDPDLGFTFSTYACTRISGSIRDGIRSENPVPKRLTTYARKVAAAEEALAQSLGRQPSLEEIANHLGEEIEALSIMPRLSPAASVDELVSNASENGSVPQWMVDSQDPLDSAVASERSRAIEEALAKLPQDDRDAVRLLVMDAMSPTEARLQTGATARQMRQRRERGLNALRSTLELWAD